MSLDRVRIGALDKKEFNVIIEIPMKSEPVKYEVDKETNTLKVDRFLETAMYYPCNYGYVPETLSEDGDPVDVMVVTPAPLIPSSVIRCRAVGMLSMEDEAGVDCKVLAVPVAKIARCYKEIESYKDLPQSLLRAISHFFQHYKDLEENKWTKIGDWLDQQAALKEIEESHKRYGK